MYVIAHNIRSLHNVGSIFRSADAFGVKTIYLTGYTGAPPRKEIAKVALGAQQRVSWEHVEDVHAVMARLAKKGVPVIALENGVSAIPINEYQHDGEIALLLGNEVEGVEKEILDQCEGTVEIPMPGAKQSLNVSVATGIALFALQSRAR